MSRIDQTLLDEVRDRARSLDIPIVWALREALVCYVCSPAEETQVETKTATADATASPSADKQDHTAPTTTPEARLC